MAGLVQRAVTRTKSVRRIVRRPEQRGLALIYLALTLTALMIFAALAVDIGLAKEAKASLQAAVDSAALTGAQILDTTQATQQQSVFDAAATETYKSMNVLTAGQTASMTGSCGSHCDDYVLARGSVTYDVQVTTPALGPLGGSPDPTLLTVKSCYGVPTTFSGVVGWRTIPICATATGQNGVGTGGPSNSGCGASDEFNNVTNTFNAAIGSQTISATYSATTPIDLTNVHFVVQTQYGNLVQIPAGPGGVGVAGQSYSVSPATGGTNVTFSYTLPNAIDASWDWTHNNNIGTGGVYSNTFTANLQVIDQQGRNCGDASWTTCNPASGGVAHDPILDGGGSAAFDTGSVNGGYGTGNNHADVTDDTSGESPRLTDPFSNTLINGDGHDVASDEYVRTRNPQTNPVAGDSDDTITPSLGTLVSAGWPVGVIYNDEQPLRAGSVSFLIDGNVANYSSTFQASSNGNDYFTFVDPSTVWTYPPRSNGTPTPVVGVPAFGAVSANVSTAATSGATAIKFSVYDNMGNPMPGESLVPTGVEPSAVTPPASTVTALNGTTGNYTIASKANGSYTYAFAYSPVAGAPDHGSGTFNVTVVWSGGSISSATLGNVNNAAAWPNSQHDQVPGGGSRGPGSSVGIMFNSANLVNGWHSVVVFANDGDVTTSGGDCGMATWVFGSTGGVPGPGTLHLIS
ncbi:MAG TPA: pilus assembly protein TadG-related protein [Acidimicrobiales bacterium]|nr:pilus assembly protein TadG-related protein [Acidimicrobiales bacterium]